ncbi:hypothetical protein QM797_19225 [Rhodococcus sp. IEGM 1381]|uniref:hypothetical protein n=1 Tax=Rhodococcus sp. IEGM 1381 TaxID=3047085 RepID=UPI0024B7EF8C|nr:hypothetical protein [Rhodococcus sp. IEGM 1381]MDI9896857.1 hypothetical protein [Rhodococcus sp. IEGM 1381]
MVDREVLADSVSVSAADRGSTDEDAGIPDNSEAGGGSALDLDGDERTPVVRSRNYRRRGLLAAVAVAIVSLGAVTVVELIHYQQFGAAQDRDQRYLQAARQSVLDLTTISAATVDDDVARVLERSTGSFREQFDQRSDDFVSVVQQANVQATGAITEAGIENADDNTASVLVAATSNVSNSSGAQQESRVWRLRISLENDGQTILVSDVEFVP